LRASTASSHSAGASLATASPKPKPSECAAWTASASDTATGCGTGPVPPGGGLVNWFGPGPNDGPRAAGLALAEAAGLIQATALLGRAVGRAERARAPHGAGLALGLGRLALSH